MRASVIWMLVLWAASPADAIDHQLLKIHNPLDGERFTQGATFAINGYLYLPSWKGELKSLIVRASVHRPANDRLVQEREVVCHVWAHKTEPGVYWFIGNIKNPKPWPLGQCVLRVDCRDQAAQETPLLATQSVFIEVAPPRQQAANRRLLTGDPVVKIRQATVQAAQR